MKPYDSGIIGEKSPAPGNTNWKVDWLIWTAIRLACILLPIVMGAVFHFSSDNFGLLFGAFLGFWAFLLVSYGEARRQYNIKAAFTHVAISHGAAMAFVALNPLIWKPGSGHPPLPAGIFVLPWLALSIIPTTIGACLALFLPLHGMSARDVSTPRLTLGDAFKLLGGLFLGYLLWPSSSMATIAYIGGPAGLLAVYAFMRADASRRNRMLVALPFIVVICFFGKRLARQSLMANREFLQAVYNGPAEQVKESIRRGENVNAVSNGYPVLFSAVMGGHADVVQALLEAGADPQAMNNMSMDWAIEHGRADIVRLLLDHGANANAARNGQPLLQLAALVHHQDIVDLLTSRGAVAHINPSAKAIAKITIAPPSPAVGSRAAVAVNMTSPGQTIYPFVYHLKMIPDAMIDIDPKDSCQGVLRGLCGFGAYITFNKPGIYTATVEVDGLGEIGRTTFTVTN